jgi:prophage regulatory protein
MQSHAILRFPAVRELTGLSRSTLWRFQQQGTFPKPVKLGANSIGWLASEVEAWLLSRPSACCSVRTHPQEREPVSRQKMRECEPLAEGTLHG